MPHRHVIISDKMMRQRIATCKNCGSRVFIGEYEDHERGDELLAEWMLRHKHEKKID